MAERQKRTIAGDKTIGLPIAAEMDYAPLVKDQNAFRTYLDRLIATHPELFPLGSEAGYCFHKFAESGKLHLSTRRIRLKCNGQAHQRIDNDLPDKARQKRLSLPNKAAQLNVTFDWPHADHTSNPLD